MTFEQTMETLKTQLNELDQAIKAAPTEQTINQQLDSVILGIKRTKKGNNGKVLEKLWTLKRVMEKGILSIDAKHYDNYTTKQLQELLSNGGAK